MLLHAYGNVAEALVSVISQVLRRPGRGAWSVESSCKKSQWKGSSTVTMEDSGLEEPGVHQSSILLPIPHPNSLCASHISTVWAPVGTAENDEMRT